ncbi:translation initiation factor IF-2-like [Balaenoptera musculus]|uniref:Translation initiation factor IF-2-like n=1 Tax=Balaenoptera musculus TaxID=9771 RepID=A0A8B8XF04_BALMU|nr:translation initiation factor IF-2-like [Balaenoptera musculus]
MLSSIHSSVEAKEHSPAPEPSGACLSWRARKGTRGSPRAAAGPSGPRAKPGGAAARVRAPEARAEHVTTPRGAGSAVPHAGGGGESNGGRRRLRGGCAAGAAAESAGAAAAPRTVHPRPPPARDRPSPSSPSASPGARRGPQFTRPVIPRLSQQCTLLPGTRTTEGEVSFLQEANFGGELSNKERPCGYSESEQEAEIQTSPLMTLGDVCNLELEFLKTEKWQRNGWDVDVLLVRQPQLCGQGQDSGGQWNSKIERIDQQQPVQHQPSTMEC